MVKGLPIFGMSLENQKPTFDMFDLFEEYGEHFMIDMSPGRGLMLASRSGHDVREVMEQKSDIFQGYASSSLPRALLVPLPFLCVALRSNLAPFLKRWDAICSSVVCGCRMPFLVMSVLRARTHHKGFVSACDTRGLFC